MFVLSLICIFCYWLSYAILVLLSSYQNKCPHMLTTASRAVSRQMLHSNIRSSRLSSSLPSPPGADALGCASLVSAISKIWTAYCVTQLFCPPLTTHNLRYPRIRVILCKRTLNFCPVSVTITVITRIHYKNLTIDQTKLVVGLTQKTTGSHPLSRIFLLTTWRLSVNFTVDYRIVPNHCIHIFSHVAKFLALFKCLCLYWINWHNFCLEI